MAWLCLNVLPARPAQARQEYAGEVQTSLGMECPPPCRTCHILPTGGKNWNTFGLQLVTPVLSGKSWPSILADLRAANVDTDGDGRADVYELEHDTDPSIAGNDRITCVLYGCGARVAADKAPDPLAALVSLGALGALTWLRARSRRRR